MANVKRLVILLFVLSLTGCSNRKSIPDGFNSDTYEYSVKALKFMEKYNAGEMQKEEVKSRLKSIDEHLDSFEATKDNWKLTIVKVDISSFIYKLASNGDTYNVAKELEELLEDD